MTKVRSRVHRILSRLHSFKPVDADSKAVLNARYLDGYSGEVFGFYENQPGSLNNSILVTEDGIGLLQAEEINFINFDDINCIEKPGDKIGSELVIRRNDKSSLSFQVQGGKFGFSDALEFLRFLNRVIEDRITGQSDSDSL